MLEEIVKDIHERIKRIEEERLSSLHQIISQDHNKIMQIDEKLDLHIQNDKTLDRKLKIIYTSIMICMSLFFLAIEFWRGTSGDSFNLLLKFLGK